MGEIWYNTGMAKAKPILYGVSDFVLMRTKGAYCIDRFDESSGGQVKLARLVVGFQDGDRVLCEEV